MTSAPVRSEQLMSTKDAVIEMIQRMPDDLTTEEVIAALHVRLRIEEGLRQLDAGEGIPQEEVVKRFSR